MIDKNMFGKNLRDYLEYVELMQTKKLVLFGAGNYARQLVAPSGFFKPEEIEFICDSDKEKWGTQLEGIPVVNPTALESNSDDYVVIISIIKSYGYYVKIIKKKLYQMGVKNVFSPKILVNSYNYNSRFHFVDGKRTDYWFHEKRSYKLVNNHIDEINRVEDFLCDDLSKKIWERYIFYMKNNLNWFFYADMADDCYEHYFSDNLFTWEKEEILVDGGCYDGADTIWFQWILIQNGCELKKVYAFEPDNYNFNKIIENVNAECDLRGEEQWSCENEVYHKDWFNLYKYGLYNHNSTERFNFSTQEGQFGGAINKIKKEGETVKGKNAIETRCLDNIVGEQKVTFIKFDLEGADYGAIWGAKETIKKNKPKLALCLYHEIEDLWRIPLLVKELVPEYKIYIRHHNNTRHEKILYAYV